MDDADLFALDLDDTPPACTRPAVDGCHVCRVGGGLAVFSDNAGRTWFCRDHAPADFFTPSGKA